MERRTGNAPQLLGEGTTDSEGSFRITYGLEQFQKGEGISSFRRERKESADVTFCIFDGTGQQLNLKLVEALDRKYRSDQIIFNVPTPLEVRITVEVSQASDSSEYEQLIGLLAPVVEDLPLAELSDEDIVFLSNELGLEQQRDVEEQIEWLRRCALLAEQSGLPIEAFYGWGRKDVPTRLGELANVPVHDLPAVVKKLAGLRVEKLREALLAAIEENIIPAGLRSRVDTIVSMLVRRDQVRRQVNAQLLDHETQSSLAGYSVTTFDQDADGQTLGLDVTDGDGGFSFAFYVPRAEPASAPARRFAFKVVTPDGEDLPEGAATINPGRDASELVPVEVKVPKPRVPSLEDQLQDGKLRLPPAISTWLTSKGIQSLADIRRKGGLRQVADAPAGDSALIRQIDALADLDRISASVQVSKAVLDKGYDSVLAIADAPRAEFVGLVRNEQSVLTELEAAKLHVMATVQVQLLNNLLAGMAADIANGFDLPDQTAAVTQENS